MRVLAILSLFLLSACGQAGDLYLPDAKTAQPPAAPTAPASDADPKKKDTK